MSGIVGSRFNIRGSGLVGSLGTDGQVFTSAGAGKSAVFEAAAGFDVTSITGATALASLPASTDEFVMSDAGTLKRVDFKHMRDGWEFISVDANGGTGGTFEFTNMSSDYMAYMYFFRNVYSQSSNSAGANTLMYARLHTDEWRETNYYSVAMEIENGGYNSRTTADAGYAQLIWQNIKGTNSQTAGEKFNGWVYIEDPHAVDTQKIVQFDIAYNNSDSDLTRVAGAFENSNANDRITGIRFYASSNSFRGSCYQYGIKYSPEA